MGINVENMKKIAQELKDGKRTWILDGSFHMNQGFTVFPIENDCLDIHVDGRGISRKLTVEEAIELSTHEYCNNTEAATALLKEIDAI